MPEHLTERQREVLENLDLAFEALGGDWWTRPADIGSSATGSTMSSLVDQGLASVNVVTEFGSLGTYERRFYRITEAGRKALEMEKDDAR